MTNSQIKCFFAVVEQGSFSSAAKSLFIAQPAVSKQVNTLEAELEIKLFTRSGHTTTLTPEGKLIYSTLKDCKFAFENALAEARQFKNVPKESSTIQFGCPLFWNTDSAYRPIENWVEKNYPWLNLSLSAYSQHEILQYVSEGHLDIAIHTEDAERRPGLVTAPFSMVNALLMYSAKSPLVRGAAEFQNINKYTLLTTFDIRNPLYRELLDSLSQYFGTDNLHTDTMSDISGIYAYLENPYNMFLASELFLWKSDPLLRYFTLPIPRKLFVTRRKMERNPEVLFLAKQMVLEFSRSSGMQHSKA